MRDGWRDDADEDSERWSDKHQFNEDLDDSSDDSWSDDSDETADQRECPMCGCDVYADAEQCPLCGEWFARNHTAWDGRPWWFVLLGIAGIVAVILSLVLM